MKKNTIVIIAACWMLVVVAFVAVAVTMRVMGGLGMDFAMPLTGVAEGGDDADAIVRRYARLEEVRKILHDEFYIELDDAELVQGAVRGIVQAADDPYTYYLSPEEHEENINHMTGTFEGIGLVLSSDEGDMIAVLRVYPGTPAEEAGVLVGDYLVKINGVDVNGRTARDLSEAVDLIKKSEDPNVVVTVLRKDELIDMPMTRRECTLARTAHHMIDGDIGYLVIYEFLGDDVVGFERAINELSAQGMKGLVIDVRNNPGGGLQDVVTICDKLLPEGLIVYTEDRAGHRDEYFSDESALGIPIAVLTNGMSASASEILAGSIQDYGVGTIVGENTYGKGIVQQSIPFRSDGASMQLTISTYFTPNGRSIHGVGIVPDVVITLPEDVNAATIELHPDQDVQLQEAVRIVSEQIRAGDQ